MVKQRVFELRLGELRQLAAAEGGKVTSELSKKIGLYFGADVMVKLLASIQALERGEALPAGASPGVDVPHVSTRDEEQSARVLVHALLCPGPGRCGRPDCNDEVAATKAYLARLEAHATVNGRVPSPQPPLLMPPWICVICCISTINVNCSTTEDFLWN